MTRRRNLADSEVSIQRLRILLMRPSANIDRLISDQVFIADLHPKRIARVGGPGK
jgi:hypothetical protein